MSAELLDAIFTRVHRRPVFVPRPVASEQLGLLYVATAAKQAGYQVEVLDTATLSIQRLINRLRFSKAQLLGFYVDHENVFATLSIGQAIKQQIPNIKLVAGGPQAREWDRKIIESGFDVAVRCEGEQVIANLIRWSKDNDPGSQLEAINGITWISDKGIIRNVDAHAVDLDQLPIPDRSLNPDRQEPDGAESIITGRGCPFRCAFCYEGRPEAKYRSRSLANVLEELEWLVTVRGARYVSILDDVFTLSANRVLEFTEGVKSIKRRTGADFIWFCEARADVIVKRPDMVHACVDSGLARMQIGMETGSQIVLDAYNKALKVDDTARAIEICRDADVLSIIGNFIIGGAFETAETTEETRKFATGLIDLAPGRIDITTTLFTPYPGTVMYDHPEKYGIEIIDKDCVSGPGDNYPFVQTKDLSRWDLVEERQKFILAVDEAMSRNASSIPIALADRHFRAYTYYGLRTSWFDHFCRYFNMYNYLGMPAADPDVVRMDDVSTNELMELKPVRTVVLGTTLDSHFIVDAGFRRLQLGTASGSLFELCAGKLRLHEIIKILKEKGLLTSSQEAIEFLKEFDNNRLIVFAYH